MTSTSASLDSGSRDSTFQQLYARSRPDDVDFDNGYVVDPHLLCQDFDSRSQRLAEIIDGARALFGKSEFGKSQVHTDAAALIHLAHRLYPDDHCTADTVADIMISELSCCPSNRRFGLWRVLASGSAIDVMRYMRSLWLDVGMTPKEVILYLPETQQEKEEATSRAEAAKIEDIQPKLQHTLDHSEVFKAGTTNRQTNTDSILEAQDVGDRPQLSKTLRQRRQISADTTSQY